MEDAAEEALRQLHLQHAQQLLLVAAFHLVLVPVLVVLEVVLLVEGVEGVEGRAVSQYAREEKEEVRYEHTHTHTHRERGGHVQMHLFARPASTCEE